MKLIHGTDMQELWRITGKHATGHKVLFNRMRVQLAKL